MEGELECKLECKLEEVVWSTGEKYEKSTKNQKPLLNADNDIINNIPYRSEYNIKKNDKINEEKSNEMFNRNMLSQTFQNPFLHKNFTEVLDDQEKYLTPQNSLAMDKPQLSLKYK